MEDFLNKLNPLPVALSKLSLLDSDDVLRISNYPKVIVYFLPNSARIANTCSLMSL